MGADNGERMNKNELLACIMITVGACVCIGFLTDCAKHATEEMTKRQYIAETNELLYFDPIMGEQRIKRK